MLPYGTPFLELPVALVSRIDCLFIKEELLMAVDWSAYSIEELHQHRIATFREGGGSRPDVLLIEIDGHRAVLKDQAGADSVFSVLLGPLLNWRETRALRRLAGVPCIPALLATPTKRAFLMSYHPSEQITKAHIKPDAWPEIFSRIEAAINAVHTAGVAHNDLRNPTNILLDQHDQPVLVDLVAAFSSGPSWNPLQRWLFAKFCQVDRSAVTKLKQRFAPHLVLDTDILPEAIAGKAGLAAKGFGQWIRRISRRLFTKGK